MIVLLTFFLLLGIFGWLLLPVIFDFLKSFFEAPSLGGKKYTNSLGGKKYTNSLGGKKYTEQEVKALIDRLPQESVESLIDDMVYWLRARDYCDGITDPHESGTYETARDQEIVSRGKQGVDLLINLLDDSDWLVRQEAARLIYEIQRARRNR